MFCFQCQETVRNIGCTVKGVCGKPEETADLQDLLIYVCKGISIYGVQLKEKGTLDNEAAHFIRNALFTTITNVAWDDEIIIERIREGIRIREKVKKKIGNVFKDELPDCATWGSEDRQEIIAKAMSDEVRVTAIENEDERSLTWILIIACKGIAAYAEHAAILGYEQDEINGFLMDALASTTKDLSAEERMGIVMKAGEMAVKVMALLDKANTSTFGNPERTEVNLNVGKRPGILISGHDLRDMDELLRQTEGKGVDIYTHGEMLPAHYYPAFKKYRHLVGHYGGSWWHQNDEFESFNGPILMTTNCLIPLRKENTYLERLFTTGVVSYPGAKHIPDRPKGGEKDFSPVIALAQKCQPPKEIESGRIIGGFAHHQVLVMIERVIEAVRSGVIKRFIVMAGCDGRQKVRSYYTELAEKLSKDTVILTAGCAKYRYNKLHLGYIGDIPRVLDAGQCNDSYSLAVIALKLKDAFGLKDVNELPISFDIAWYEQKAVAVLLALLSLGVKGIRLGPTLPGFLSPNVAKVLVEKFNLKPIGTVEGDIAAMMKGE